MILVLAYSGSTNFVGNILTKIFDLAKTGFKPKTSDVKLAQNVWIIFSFNVGHTYDEYMAWNLAAFLTISTLKAEADLERIADYGNMGAVVKFKVRNAKFKVM